MKAIIVLREDQTKWLRSYFPSAHPAMVPICNKPLLEYILDFIILSKCSHMIICLEASGSDIKAYFENGARWGIHISYCRIEPDEIIDGIIKKNMGESALENFPLLLMDGIFFIHYDKSDFKVQWEHFTDAGLLVSCISGNLLIAATDQELKNISSVRTGIPFALSEIESLDDLFRLNMEILEAEQSHYVLPGYRESESIVYGKNVKAGANVKILPPVIIGNDVRLQDDVSIGPYAVIGHNVIVDEKSEVEKSVILPNTYIGQALHLTRKVVDKKRIISYPRGIALDIEDPSLFSFLPPNSDQIFKGAGRGIKAVLKKVQGYLSELSAPDKDRK